MLNSQDGSEPDEIHANILWYPGICTNEIVATKKLRLWRQPICLKL